MRSIGDLVAALVDAGLRFSVRRNDKGEFIVSYTAPWPDGQEPPKDVKPLLKDMARRGDKVSQYLLHAEPLGEATSLRGEHLRVYQARPLCVLSRTCWRTTLGCKLYPDASEYGWLKRCRHRVGPTNRQDAARERVQ